MGFDMARSFMVCLFWCSPAAAASGSGESEGSSSCTYSLAAEQMQYLSPLTSLLGPPWTHRQQGWAVRKQASAAAIVIQMFTAVFSHRLSTTERGTTQKGLHSSQRQHDYAKYTSEGRRILALSTTIHLLNSLQFKKPYPNHLCLRDTVEWSEVG
jgi:hypothetical protein